MQGSEKISAKKAATLEINREGVHCNGVCICKNRQLIHFKYVRVCVFVVCVCMCVCFVVCVSKHVSVNINFRRLKFICITQKFNSFIVDNTDIIRYQDLSFIVVYGNNCCI